MRVIKIIPDGWECKIEECPPGLFVYKGEIGFKTEYNEDDGDIIAYSHSGEYFITRNIKVQPVIFVEEEV